MKMYTKREAEQHMGEITRRYIHLSILSFPVRAFILDKLQKEGYDTAVQARPVYDEFCEEHPDEKMAYNSFQAHLNWLETQEFIETKLVKDPHRLRILTLTRLGFFVATHLWYHTTLSKR